MSKRKKPTLEEGHRSSNLNRLITLEDKVFEKIKFYYEKLNKYRNSRNDVLIFITAEVLSIWLGIAEYIKENRKYILQSSLQFASLATMEYKAKVFENIFKDIESDKIIIEQKVTEVMDRYIDYMTGNTSNK